MFPTVAGADVVAYNVKALADKDPLVLDGKTVAGIFLGKITKWNDPAIAALNPGVALPDQDIIVVHRSDGSGTTYIFTDYLSKVSDEWKTKVGNATSVEWPVGLGGKGNEGVSGTLGQNDGSIGYVELAYAIGNKLPYAKMLNAAGATVEAKIESTQAAMADFAGQMPDSLAVSIVNAPGAESWPIAGYTYLLLYMDQTDCAKGQGHRRLPEVGAGEPTAPRTRRRSTTCRCPTRSRRKDLAKLGRGHLQRRTAATRLAFLAARHPAPSAGGRRFTDVPVAWSLDDDDLHEPAPSKGCCSDGARPRALAARRRAVPR